MAIARVIGTAVKAPALCAIVALLLASPAWAQKKGGRSSGSSSSSSAAGKTVHVEGYTRADGTRVEGYDRRAPGTAPASGSTASSATAATPKAGGTRVSPGLSTAHSRTTPPIVNKDGIHTVVDPATGRRTYTDRPLAAVHPPAAPVARPVTRSMPASHTHSGIVRSAAAKHTFEVKTGYPHGRPGYVVDHIIPLACGGADAPSNMQWQTIEAGKAKDKVERKGCGK